MCHGKEARRAAIFQRELCEAVLVGLKNYMVRHRRMKHNELFYASGCGIMIDGDDDVQLHHRNSDHAVDEPAEVHFAGGEEYDSIGKVTDFGRDGSKLGWAPLADDGKPGDRTKQDATRQTPLPKS